MAIDTDVLLRLVVNDDQRQAEAVRAALADVSEVMLTVPVLLEFVWTLRRGFRMSSSDIVAALRTITGRPGVVLPMEEFQAGVAMLNGGGDFADGVIVASARRMGFEAVLTFDKEFARLGGALPITLLKA